MNKANKSEQIEAYIKGIFEMYHLSYEDFFHEFDDEENKHFELPIVSDGKLVMSIVERVATCLGVTSEDVLKMNDDATERWFNKYPYFIIRHEFDYAYHESYYNPNFESKHLMAVLFNKLPIPEELAKYDYESVKRRLLSLVDEYAEAFPGIKHKGETLSFLKIYTETMFQFKEFENLITSYLDMFHQFKMLFYKAWDTDLSVDEIQEYNFLVSCLGIRDSAYKNDRPLYYELLKAFVPIYKEEGYKSTFSYIKVDDGSVPFFWKCANFADYPDLAKQFIEIYPKAKLKMRRHMMDAKNFRCAYLWSDEKKPEYTPEYELYILGMLHDFDDDRGGAYHYLYVPKTEEELGEANEYIDKFSILSGPEALGGLPMPKPEVEPLSAKMIGRMQSRIAVAPKMNWGGELYE